MTKGKKNPLEVNFEGRILRGNKQNSDIHLYNPSKHRYQPDKRYLCF